MIHNTSRAFVCAVTLAMLAALLVPGSAAAQDQGMTRMYSVENVSLDSAVRLAQSICSEAARVAQAAARSLNEVICDVTPLMSERKLAVTAPADLQARVAALLDELDRMPLTKSFQVIVLAATLEGTGTLQDLDIPPAARQALEDFATLMPYEGFQVVGSSLLRTSEGARSTLPGAEELQISINFRPVSDPAAPILVENFSISQDLGMVRSGDSLQRRTRSVLGTTFTINPGETTVVGTSTRAGEEGALVVLVTALRD